MTEEEALFFAELWLSDKCNKAEKTMSEFMEVVFEILTQRAESRGGQSLICNDKECFICGKLDQLHKHHIFKASNRNFSEEDGCWIWLCGADHNLSNAGVHYNKQFNITLEKYCQHRWEEVHGDREAFRKRYGRSWL